MVFRDEVKFPWEQAGQIFSPSPRPPTVLHTLRRT